MVVLTTQPIAFLKLKIKVCSATFIKAINGIRRNILQYIKWYKNEHTKAKAPTIRHIKMVIHNFFYVFILKKMTFCLVFTRKAITLQL